LGWGTELGGCERHVDVFEEDLPGDPSYAVSGLDEVIAGAAGLLAAESVGKDEWFCELTSAHQEAGAVDSPLTFEIHKHFFHLSAGPGVCVWLSAFRFRPSTALLGGILVFRVERLYAQKQSGSITKELCNGGIRGCVLDTMNPHHASIAGTCGWRASGGV